MRRACGWLVLILLALGGTGLGATEARAQTVLTFDELYSRVTPLGMEFSPKLVANAGKQVSLAGFMAPPLKPKLDFFVLTRLPMATCPFCTTAADWPPDIVLVLMPRGREAQASVNRLRVTGRLEIGAKTDTDTGFVSLVRIYADRLEELR